MPIGRLLQHLLCAPFAAKQGSNKKDFAHCLMFLYQILWRSIYAYLFICALWLIRNILVGATALPPIIIYKNFPNGIKTAGACLLPWLLRQPPPAVTTELVTL